MRWTLSRTRELGARKRPSVRTPPLAHLPSPRGEPRPGLARRWSPALQIRTVLLSIQALLSAPNPDDPLDNGVAELWKKNEPEALSKGASGRFAPSPSRAPRPAPAPLAAAQWTEAYAKHG